MTQQGVQRKFGPAGLYEMGDAILTIGADSPLYDMGQFDRVLMLNSTSPFSLTLTRGANDKLHQVVSAISRVFWLAPDKASIIEGGIPSVASDGTLTWASGAPPSGTQYSVTGEWQDEYFCFQELTSDRAEHSGAALPKKVHLRKFDLFGRMSG